MSGDEHAVTVLLRAWSDGDAGALDRLTPLVYDELRRLAGAYMRRERAGHSLGPTDLVNEAFARLAGGEHPPYAGRLQFLAVAARQMRRVLVDHARRRAADKRGGAARVTFDEGLYAGERPEELVALDDAIEALAAVDPRKAKVIDLHYFGGLGQKEIAEVLGVHENTVARDLRLGEAWLKRELGAG
jgi:RNA polymerase sigma factor (TIGR02999 family)